MAVSSLEKENQLQPPSYELNWVVREKLSNRCETRTLRKNETILSQSECPEKFHLLQNGLLGMFRNLPSGKSVLIGKVRPGECIGLTQLLSQNPFNAELRPIKNSTALEGTREDFEAINLKDSDALDRALLKESYLLEKIYRRVQWVLSQEIQNRIARELIEFAHDAGRKQGQAIEILIKLCRKDISQMVACTPESVSRVMCEMERKGTIATQSKMITIMKPKRLLRKVDIPRYSDSMLGSNP
ncbi:MAG: Crp/Fnr family transcriptional regulator [bacterium]